MIKSFDQCRVQRRIVTRVVLSNCPVPHHQQPIRLHGQRQVGQQGDDGVGVGEAAEQPCDRDLIRRVEVGGGLIRQQHWGFRGEHILLHARFIASNIRTGAQYLDI